MMTVPIQSPLSWEKAINTFLHIKQLSGFSPATSEWYEVTLDF